MNPTIRLEPDLQEIAADWTACKRLRMARQLARWAHQLEISGRIMLTREFPNPPPRPRPLARRKLLMN